MRKVSDAKFSFMITSIHENTDLIFHRNVIMY